MIFQRLIRSFHLDLLTDLSLQILWNSGTLSSRLWCWCIIQDSLWLVCDSHYRSRPIYLYCYTNVLFTIPCLSLRFSKNLLRVFANIIDFGISFLIIETLSPTSLNISIFKQFSLFPMNFYFNYYRLECQHTTHFNSGQLTVEKMLISVIWFD